MLNSISRLGETRPDQEWSNGTEVSGYPDFPEKRVHSKRIPKFSKTFPGIFTVPFSFGPEISEFLAEWKAPPNTFIRILLLVFFNYEVLRKQLEVSIELTSVCIETTFNVYRNDFSCVSKRLVSKRLVSKRLCIETTVNRKLHLVKGT